MVGVRRLGPAERRARQLLRCGAAKLGRLGRDNRGTVVVLAGIILPVLVGGMGLGAEAGYWYWTQRKVQHAADVAAYAAGVRKLQGEDDKNELKKVAKRVAEEAGFVPGDDPVVNTPYDGSSDKIEVILTETPDRLLTSLFIDGELRFSGRAVVFVEDGQTACVLALSPSAPAAVSLQGSTQVTLNGCDVASNSSAPDGFSLGGSARMTTGCVHSAGGASYTSGLVLKPEDDDSPCADGTPNEYTRSTRDPYRNVDEPDYDSLSCDNDKNVGKNSGKTVVTPNETLSNGVKAKRYCKGLHIKGDVKFKEGIYVIEGGDFTLNSSHIVEGSEVTFFIRSNASLSFNGASSADLSAPTSGPYSGILFFGERSGTSKRNLLNGDSTGIFTGAVYFPGSEVDYRGSGSSGGGCIQIIGDEVSFGGDATVESNCSKSTHGTTEIAANRGVTLIE